MKSPLSLLTSTDWRKLNNKQIAARFGLKPNYVACVRRLHGKPQGPRTPGSGRLPKLDQSLIDWSQSNAENATRLNCTPQYMAFLRRKKAVIEDFA